MDVFGGEQGIEERLFGSRNDWNVLTLMAEHVRGILEGVVHADVASHRSDAQHIHAFQGNRKR